MFSEKLQSRDWNLVIQSKVLIVCFIVTIRLNFWVIVFMIFCIHNHWRSCFLRLVLMFLPSRNEAETIKRASGDFKSKIVQIMSVPWYQWPPRSFKETFLLNRSGKAVFSRGPNDLEISYLSNVHLVSEESVRQSSFSCPQVQRRLVITKDFDWMWWAWWWNAHKFVERIWFHRVHGSKQTSFVHLLWTLANWKRLYVFHLETVVLG